MPGRNSSRHVSKIGDAVKREQWRRRFERFEAGEQSIAQFCRDEGVGTHTFYYWSRQLGRMSGGSGRSRGRLKDGRAKQYTAKEAAGSAVQSVQPERPEGVTPVVQFTWHSQLSFSIPANCLDAIRCVLEFARQADPRERQDGAAVANAFRQVIVN